MADQASTPAMLMTRPSRWLGTICRRRLTVLTLKKMPRPEMAAHSASATQYQRVAASTMVSRPSSRRAPRAATLNDSRRRTGPAASDNSTTPVSFTLDRYGHLYPESDAALRDRLDAIYSAGERDQSAVVEFPRGRPRHQRPGRL
jgi:hypothetical protein